MELKRDPIKYVRDRAKSRYVKAESCRICGATEDLDFHHFKTVSILIHAFVRENGLDPNDVLEWRDSFIESHEEELYELAVTLCHAHHLKLHEIYGRNPELYTAGKQERWVERMRTKNGLAS